LRLEARLASPVKSSRHAAKLGDGGPADDPRASSGSCKWWLVCLCLLLLFAVGVVLLTETGDAPYVYPPS
jgi:hypothetical protein